MTIDGPGGVGKSRTTGHLQRRLAARGNNVHATAEPSKDVLGRLARRPGTYTGRALACLVAADRYHHLDTEVRPALDAGRIVISDRYVPSSYVLQRIDGVPLDFIEAINDDADIPDLSVLLTATPKCDSRPDRTTRDAQPLRDRRRRQPGRGRPLPGGSRKPHRTGYSRLTIDTTDTPADHAAEIVADRLLGLAGLSPPEVPTA